MFLLHPADNYTERFMWRRGLRAEAASIGRLTLLVAGKRALVFDVGANCGAFTLPLATAAGPGSRIVAFEPNPVMAARLRTNLALNGLTESVHVVEVALGAQDGEAPLNLVERNLGRSSLRPVDSIIAIPVAVRLLAPYLPEHSHRYETFIVKIDVEGYEDEVLVPFLTTIPGNACRTQSCWKRIMTSSGAPTSRAFWKNEVTFRSLKARNRTRSSSGSSTIRRRTVELRGAVRSGKPGSTAGCRSWCLPVDQHLLSLAPEPPG